MANKRFFDQKVKDLFRGENNQVRKYSPVYNGYYLEVFVELFDGKYYLSFKKLGYAMGDYSKRIRKTMTMREIDNLISEYYDKVDAMHRKCVETYNKAMRCNFKK